MDDVKDKVKGLIKKVNNPFNSSSSSSGRFKGQGRVLGSSSSSSPIGPTPKPTPPPLSSDPQTSTNPIQPKPTPPPPSSSNSSYPSHQHNQLLSSCIAAFVSEAASVEVVLKLFKNIIKEPENPKFRKIRLSNPKIREAIVDVSGGVELLECVGFVLQDDDQSGEMLAVITHVPDYQQVSLIKQAVLLLEPSPIIELPLGFSITSEPSMSLLEEPTTKSLLEEGTTSLGDLVGVFNSTAPPQVEEPAEQLQKIDRQVRVFFSGSESISAKMDVPDSFYSLSASELKREADARKKQIAESQLLIPKSYKERKAKDARKRYKTTVIRIQFPDEVVLQGVFLPWEPTTALYEFVSSSLKEPCLEFELSRPAVPKPRVIPRFPGPRERTPTLDEEDLVPSAVIKFKPIEIDSIVFTGLSNELLEISESLTNRAAP